MKYQIINGDNRAVLKTFPDNHFDSIVTDPPYGIDFLGKSWDANTGALETYQECLRVLKPGGHILAFSAARTYHHLAITLEQAGFEIRDQIMWIYSSGFPKSQDVGRQLHKKENGKPDKQRYSKDEMTKEGDNYRHNDNKKLYRILPDINGDRLEKSHEGQGYGYIFEEIITIDNAWAGWGTALKPAHEPIALARKPIKGSIRDNVLKHGVGALNIDATRVPYEDENDQPSGGEGGFSRLGFGEPVEKFKEQKKKKQYDIRVYKQNQNNEKRDTELTDIEYGEYEIKQAPEGGRFPSNVIGEIAEPYQKYFYCPKVSRRERHIGHENPGPQTARERDDKGNVLNRPAKKAGASANVLVEQFQLNDKGNNHPTVKPIELMKYLIKLITPKGGRVLDPFNGSGSTGCAAVELGFEYVGIELDPKYVEIATKRIEAWNKEETTFTELFQ